MICSCKTNILRSFIRNVAQLDLQPSIRTVNPRIRTSVRGISSSKVLQLHRTTRNALAAESTPFNYVKNHVSETPSGSENSALRTSKLPHDGNPPRSAESTQRGSADADRLHTVIRPEEKHDGSKQRDEFASSASHNVAEPPALLEITSDAIEALAAESKREPASINHPREVSDSSFRRRPVQTRRMQSDSKSFTLHYSSPVSELRPTKFKPNPNDIKASYTANSRDPNYEPPTREPWQTQKAALKEKFEEGWNPRKRLSPDALAGIRAIHQQFPEEYTTTVLANKFEVSPEAIRRILKSKWTPKEDEKDDRNRRWFNRGQKVWSRYAELGVKPPKRWRQLGIGKEQRPENKGPEQKPKPVEWTTSRYEHEQEPDDNFGSRNF